MAGLLDQHVLAGNDQAYAVLLKVAAWVGRNVKSVISRGGMELWQTVLDTEWGGMNEVYIPKPNPKTNPKP